MRATFDKAFEFAMMWEEYISHVPGDRGGLTIWGIASAFWPEEVKVMEKMSKADSRAYAKEFYFREFWKKAGCDDLAYPLDLCVFDAAVNCGVGEAKLLLKKEAEDWHAYNDLRIKFYNDSKREDLDDGWINRIVQDNPEKPGLNWFIRREEHPITEGYKG